MNRRRLKLPALLLPAVLVVCLAYLPARANFSAPLTLRSPSGALAESRPGELKILAETLEITCDQNCRIEAVYHIQARNGGRFELNFILPRPTQISVRVNNIGQEVTSRPFTWKLPEQERKGPRIIEDIKMARATFGAELKPGPNIIRVGYQQPWGKDQRIFGGYFSGWKSAQEISYELWPLKEWHLAKDFSLKLKVYISEKPAQGRRAMIEAFGDRLGPGRTLLLTPPQKGYEPVRLDLEWGTDFPDRIRLLLGTSKMLGLKPEPQALELGKEPPGR